MQSGQRVFAKPAPGVTFRKPDGQPIDQNGEEVVLDSFWIRRRSEGAVTLTEIKKKPEAKS